MFTKPDRLILGGVVPAMIVVCAVILKVSGEAPLPIEVGRASTSPSKASPTTAALPKWVTVRDAGDYSAIAARGLFAAEAAPQSTDEETPAPVDPQPRETRTISALVHNPQADRVTVVGHTRIGDEEMAVVEDFGRGETKHVPMGGEAFGYRVLRVEYGMATLEREGQTFQLELGAYKPEFRRGRGPSGSTQVQTPFGTMQLSQLDAWRNEARKNAMVRTPVGAFSSDDIHNLRDLAGRNNGLVEVKGSSLTKQELDQLHEQAHAAEPSATLNTPFGQISIAQIDEWRRSVGAPVYNQDQRR